MNRYIGLRASGLVLLALFFCPFIGTAGASEPGVKESSELRLGDHWYLKEVTADVGTPEGLSLPIGPDAGWNRHDLPDYWTRHWIRRASPGTVLFANRFVLPSAAEDLFLYVPGADDDAEYYLNGSEIGRTKGYSEDVALDAGPHLRKGENLLTVRLKRTRGTEKIYGPVRLVDKTRLVGVSHPDISKEHARPSVAWVKDAVIYELYPRSFSKDESFASIVKALPELRRLGVTVLWLMPIHPIGEIHRKGRLGSPYSVRDYYGINPEYGNLSDFRHLVEAVHREGMHIIIDLVINHTAWDNPLVKEHPDWYKHDSAGRIVAPNPDWTDVAQLDYSKPGLREYMLKMMKYWVRDVGIDGYRCDVAEMVPLDFWDQARTALDSIKPVMMLAEGARPDLHLKAFDLTYAWNIYDVLGSVFEGRTGAAAIDSVLEREKRSYPIGSLRLRFNTNHDKNAFDAPSVERYGSAGDSLTIALMATLPGVPLIYNGDEVGNMKRLSLFDQVTIDWNGPEGYRKLYTEIYNLRRSRDELTGGEYIHLRTGDPGSVFAFERKMGDHRSVCVFNLSGRNEDQVEVTLPKPDGIDLADAITGHSYRVEGSELKLSLKRYGFIILISKR